MAWKLPEKYIHIMNRSDASAVVIIAMTANAFTEDKTKALKWNGRLS